MLWILRRENQSLRCKTKWPRGTCFNKTYNQDVEWDRGEGEGQYGSSPTVRLYARAYAVDTMVSGRWGLETGEAHTHVGWALFDVPHGFKAIHVCIWKTMQLIQLISFVDNFEKWSEKKQIIYTHFFTMKIDVMYVTHYMKIHYHVHQWNIHVINVFVILTDVRIE